MSDLPNPGSDEAVKQGCKCPVLDNEHGTGYMGMAGMFVYSGSCELHAQSMKKECVAIDKKEEDSK